MLEGLLTKQLMTIMITGYILFCQEFTAIVPLIIYFFVKRLIHFIFRRENLKLV